MSPVARINFRDETGVDNCRAHLQISPAIDEESYLYIRHLFNPQNMNINYWRGIYSYFNNFHYRHRYYLWFVT